MDSAGRLGSFDYPWRLYAGLVVAFGAAAGLCFARAWGTPAPPIGLAAFATTCWIAWRRWQSHQRLVESIVGVTIQGANVSLPLALRSMSAGIVPRVEAVIAESVAFWAAKGDPRVRPEIWRGLVVEFVAHDRLLAGGPTFGAIEAHGLVAGRFIGVAWGPADTWSTVAAKLRHESDHIALMAMGVKIAEHHRVMAENGRG